MNGTRKTAGRTLTSKLLAWVLTFAMFLGALPGTTLTALAEPEVPSVSLGADTEITGYKGDTGNIPYNLHYEGNSISDFNVDPVSSDSGIVEVNATDGVVNYSLKNKGTAQINITFSGTYNWIEKVTEPVYVQETESDGTLTGDWILDPNGATTEKDEPKSKPFSVTRTVSVTVKEHSLTVDVDEAETISKYVDDTGVFSASAYWDGTELGDAAISYGSSNGEIVTVDSKTGNYFCKGIGVAVITVTATKDDKTATKQINITVSEKETEAVDNRKVVGFRTTGGESKDIAPNGELPLKTGDSIDVVALAQAEMGGEWTIANDATWASDDESVAVVNGGVVKAVGSGITHIKAALSNGASAMFTVKVEENTDTRIVKITAPANAANQPMTVGGKTFAAKAKVYESADENAKEASATDLTWSSSNQGVASVDPTGIVTAVSKGTANIIAALSNGASAMFTVEVEESKDDRTLTITLDGAEIKNGDNQDFNVGDTKAFTAKVVDEEGNPADASDLVWETSSESVATVDNAGIVKVTGYGITCITATLSNGESVFFYITVTPEQDDRLVDFFTVDGNMQNTVKVGGKIECNIGVSKIIRAGEGLQDDYKIYDIDDVTWKSSNPSVASIDESGILKGEAVGIANITATLSNGASATFMVDVKDSKENEIVYFVPDGNIGSRIKSPGSMTLNIGGDKMLTVGYYIDENDNPSAITPYAAEDVTWSSTNPEVASVNAAGYVKGISVGVTNITARIYGDKVATLTVKVEDPKETSTWTVESLSLGENDSIRVGESAQIQYKVMGGESLDIDYTKKVNPNDFTWKSSNTNVATVDEYGIVTGLKPGQTSITATLPNGKSNTIQIEVTEVSLTASQTSITVDLNGQTSLDLKAYLILESPDENITLENVEYICSAFNEGEIAEVDEEGVVTLKSIGTAIVKASIKGYENQTVTFNIAVTDSTKPAKIVISYKEETEDGEVSLQIGEKETEDLKGRIEVTQGDETLDPADNDEIVTWSSSDDTVASVVDGVVKAVAPGTAVVTAKTVDGYYVTFTVKVESETLSGVKLKDGESSIIGLVLGSETQDNKDLAELVVDNELGKDPAAFTWTVEDDSIVSLADGVVKATAVGNTKVTVTAPDGSSVTFLIEVKKVGLIADPTAFDLDLKTIEIGNWNLDLKKYITAVNCSKADLVWYTADTDILEVTNGDGGDTEEKGIVTLTGETGIAHVRALYEEDDDTSAYVDFTFRVSDSTAPDPIIVTYNSETWKPDTDTIEVIEKQVYAPNLVNYVTVTGGDASDLSWESADESIARVVDGVVIGVSAGETVITASTADGSYVTFNVKVLPKLSLTATQTSITVDRKAQTSLDLKTYLILSSPDGDGKKTLDDVEYTYSDSNEEIAAVDAEGIVSFNGTGTVTVKASIEGYEDQTIIFTINVIDSTEPAKIVISYKEGENGEVPLQIGEKETEDLKGRIEVTQGDETLDPADNDEIVTWSSSDDTVASVVNGVVKAAAPGTAVVTAKTADGYYVTFTVTVKPETLASVVLNGDNMIYLTLDDKENASEDLTKRLIAKKGEEDADASAFDWVSEDPSVATVANGTVAAVDPGWTTVTVTAPDGSSVTFIVCVSAGGFDEATLTEENLEQIVLQLDAKDNDHKELPEIKAKAGKVTWTVEDESIAKISGNSLIQGVAEGLTAAIATAPDGSTVAVSVKVLAAPVVTVGPSESYEQNVNLELNAETGGADYKDLTDGIKAAMAGVYGESAPDNDDLDLLSQITWSSSDESVAVVVDGLVIAQGVGNAVVTAAAPDGSTVVFYVTVTETLSSVELIDGEDRIINLVLGSGTQDNKDLAELVVDNELGKDPAAFAWTVEDDSIVSLADGVVRATAVGNTKVTVTAPDGSKVTFLIFVSSGTFGEDVISDWSAELYIGAKDKESAALPEITTTAGKVTWSVADESIAKIVGNLVTAVSAGKTYAVVTAEDGSQLAYPVTVYAKPVLSFSETVVKALTGESVVIDVNKAPADAEVVYSVTLDGEEAAANTDYVLVESDNGKFTFIPMTAGRFVVTGTVTVEDENNKATASVIITALQDVEKVAFEPAELILWTGETADLEALIKWNDGNSTPNDTSLTWTSGNDSVASVDESGIVTANKAGSVLIYAKAYNGLRASIKITVKQAVTGVKLSADSFELWEEQTALLEAEPVPADAEHGSVVYESADPDVATVDSQTGLIRAVKGGSTYITATMYWVDAQGTMQSVSAKASVLVKAPVKTVDVYRVDTESSETIYSNRTGEQIQLAVKIQPDYAYDKTVEWRVEDGSVADVDDSGLVTTKGKGVTYVYAKCMSGGYGLDGKGTPAVGMIQLVVGGDAISLSLSPVRSVVYPGETVQLTPALSPSTAIAGTVQYSSDNAGVTVDSTGMAMVAGNADAGLATITATMTMVDGTEYTAKALIYIKAPVKSVAFASSSMTMYVGEDATLAPIFNGGASTPDDTSLTWTVSNGSILTVDSYGKIHANNLGQAWVYATAYNGLRAEILVTVISAPTGISLSESSVTLWSGETVAISSVLSPANVTETGVTWISSNPNVAYYSDGRIVGVAGGTCVITATANDQHNGVFAASVKVTVKQRTTGITLSKTKMTKKVGDFFKLTATVLPATATNKVVYWTSSKPSVAIVDEFGIVTCLKKGKTTITAITADGHTASLKLTVKKGSSSSKVTKYGVTNVDGLFIRKTASLQGVQLGQFSRGTSVTIVATVGEWYKIKYNGGYAYVRSTYVTITSSSGKKTTVDASNAKISTKTWIYTGVGTGANTVAPVGTRVLVLGQTGSYYQIRYGTKSVGVGYVPVSCVKKDSGFQYGVASKSSKKTSSKVSSTPQVTLYRTAKTKKSAYVYANATGSGKVLGKIMKNTKLVLNSQKINGYYQVVFTNGVTGYVKSSYLKLLKTKVKSNVTTTNTYVSAYK